MCFTIVSYDEDERWAQFGFVFRGENLQLVENKSSFYGKERC